MVNANSEIEQVVHNLMRSVMPLVVHKDGIVVYSNEAASRVLGYDPAVSFVGTPATQFVEPEEREEALRTMEEMLKKGEIVRSVVRRCISADGKVVRLLCTVIPMPWQGGMAAAITFIPMEQDSNGAGLRMRARRARSVESLGLSPREKQVATFVAQGFNVQNIASLLKIQRETVRTHIKSIYRKTNTHTRVELTRIMLGARNTSPKAEGAALRSRVGSRSGRSARAQADRP